LKQPTFLFFCVQTILKIPGFTDNVVTHILSGLGAGFFAVCIGSPVDVVKYLLMTLNLEFIHHVSWLST